jgi:hypothetical protein
MFGWWFSSGGFEMDDWGTMDKHAEREKEDDARCIQDEIDACQRILNGETVNGIKMGMSGITREWVEATLKSLKACQ